MNKNLNTNIVSEAGNKVIACGCKDCIYNVENELGKNNCSKNFITIDGETGRCISFYKED